MIRRVFSMARKKLDAQREAEKVLKYPTYYYLPFNLLDGDILTAEEQRAELKRLLPIARKRQKRLRESEFADTYSAKVQLPTLRELKTERSVSSALAEVSLFIGSRRSLVRGAREYQQDVKDTLEQTFKDVAEVDFSDESFNWKQFGRYMQQMKRLGKASEGADSERAVKMFFIAKKVGLTPAGLRDNYDKFLEQQSALQQLYENNPFGRRNVSGEKMHQRLESLRK